MVKKQKKIKKQKKVKVKGKKQKVDKVVEKQHDISSLCNIAGLEEAEQGGSDPFTEDLDDCLAAMDQTLKDGDDDGSPKVESEDLPREKDTSSNGNEAKGEGVDSKSKHMDKLWKGPGSGSTNKKLTTFTDDFILPNIQVELTRHKQIYELSTYLLSSCPSLRMPAFERWLIDSKMEERVKRQRIRENAQTLKTQEEFAKGEKWKRRQKRKRQEEKEVLEHHMTSSGLRAMNDYDPVIPSMADMADQSSQRLMEEIRRGRNMDNKGKDNPKLSAKNRNRPGEKEICRELCRKACDTRNLQSLHYRLGTLRAEQYFTKPSMMPGRIALERNDNNNDNDDAEASQSQSEKGNSKVYSLVYRRKVKTKGAAQKNPKPFIVKINELHYMKLRDMFHSVHARESSLRPMQTPVPWMLEKNPNKYSAATNVFHHLVFCMLLRYAALSGAQQIFDLRGGGMQGAINTEVFDCIEEMVTTSSRSEGNIIECFASPLNVYNSNFCSLFPEDRHFGSFGDFFSLPLGFFRGTHEANPPFCPGMMESMIDRMEEHLSHADADSKNNKNDNDESGTDLSFVIVVPKCSMKKTDNLVDSYAAKSFKKMLGSPHFSKHIVLSKSAHGYIEASQHLRPTRYKESQYDTSIIILQSKGAKVKKHLIGETFEMKIREAFASRHHLELSERREKSSSASMDTKDTTV